MSKDFIPQSVEDFLVSNTILKSVLLFFFFDRFLGHPPFLGESKEILKEKVLNKEFPTPKVKGKV